MEPKAILLLDDDPVFLRLLEKTVMRGGYTVHKANDAQKALTILCEVHIDCVISDYNMPGIDGADFFKSVKTKYPHIVRILITGEADTERASRATSEGAVFRCLTKPFKPLMLLSVLGEAFQKEQDGG